MSSTTITGMRNVGVPVTDQDRALGFYCDQLGLEKRMDVYLDQIASRWIEVGPAGGGTAIALVLAGEHLPAGVETGIHLTCADAAALHEQLRAAGAEVGELLRWPGVPPMFTVADPDGNGLEITE